MSVRLVNQASAATAREFKVVSEQTNPHLIPIIAEIFRRILTPLYGNQDKAIQQIRESQDRVCYLLFENNDPVGVLVYKTFPSNEFALHGVENSIEVKSLFVDNSGKNSGKGLGSELVSKLIQEVSKIEEPHLGIHVTVSETKQESLSFFQKKGFKIVHEWKDRYIPGVTEYLLSCPEKIQRANQVENDLVVRFDRFWRGQNNYNGLGFVPQLCHIINEAHFGDIHCLTKLSNGNFLSGSKDNSISMWDKEGDLIQHVFEVEPFQRSPRDWITAMTVLNEEYWLSGERNGRISLWNTEGNFMRDIKLHLPSPKTHFSHEFNSDRVNCFGIGLNPYKPSLFVGNATTFSEYNLFEDSQSVTKVHDNDWVYCLNPVDSERLLVVTGCALDIFQRKGAKGWDKVSNLIEEPARIKKKEQSPQKRQRPFISSLQKLKGENRLYTIGVFDGSVKVIDIETKQITNEWKEHKGRIWSVQSLQPHYLVSSGDDRSLKFYDTREKESVHIIQDHVGSVSALLSYDDNLLLASTCPDNARKGAQIRFYDVRKSNFKEDKDGDTSYTF